MNNIPETKATNNIPDYFKYLLGMFQSTNVILPDKRDPKAEIRLLRFSSLHKRSFYTGIETISLEGTFCDTVQVPSGVDDMQLI